MLKYNEVNEYKIYPLSKPKKIYSENLSKIPSEGRLKLLYFEAKKLKNFMSQTS